MGIFEGIGDNGLVLGSLKDKVVIKKIFGACGWTSFLECCSVEGLYLLPLVIYKGKSV